MMGALQEAVRERNWICHRQGAKRRMTVSCALQGRKASAFSSDSEKGSDKEKSSGESNSDMSDIERALEAAAKVKESIPARPAPVLKRQPLAKRGRNMVRPKPLWPASLV